MEVSWSEHKNSFYANVYSRELSPRICLVRTVAVFPANGAEQCDHVGLLFQVYTYTF